MGATWIKLDDTFPGHPKMLEAGEDASWLFVLGLCHCSRHLTDGFIAKHVLPHLTAKPRPERLAAALVSVGAWVEVDGGWVVNDYTKKQRSREQVEGERARARERAARSRELRRDKSARAGGVTGAVTEPDMREDLSAPLLRDAEPTDEQIAASIANPSSAPAAAKAADLARRARSTVSPIFKDAS